MENQCPLPFSQESASCPYLEPDTVDPVHPLAPSAAVRLDNILPSTPKHLK
jgi:hypothetical protein